MAAPARVRHAAPAGAAPSSAGAWAGRGNSAPPGRSRFPVSTFSTSTSQLARRAELLGAGADAAVARRRAGRRGEVARQRRGCAPRGDAAGAAATASGANSRASSATRSTPLRELREAAELHEPLREQHVHQREEQVGIAPGPHEDVLVGDAPRSRCGADRRRRAGRRARAASPEPAGEVGRRHQAAVRGQRVRAEHQQEVGVVDVGDRHGERRAEQQARAHHLRELVDARRREAPARAEGAQERRARRAARRSRGRSDCRRRRRSRPPRGRSRIGAEPRGHPRQGLVPARLAPAAPRRGSAGGVSRSGSSWRPFSP